MAQAWAAPLHKSNLWLFLISCALCLGLIFSFASSYPQAYIGHNDIPGDALKFFKRQIFFAGIGCLIGLWACRRTPAFFQKYALGGLIFSLAAMLLAIIQGHIHGGTRGAYCWLRLGPLPPLQPSEFAKLFYVIYLAQLFHKGSLSGAYGKRIRRPYLLALSAFAILLIGQHDLGMLLLILLVTLAMCFLAGAPKWKTALYLVLLGGGCIAFGYVNEGEYGERWRAFLNPEADPSGAGYHVLTMLVTIAQGGMWGQGLGFNFEKHCHLPEAHTDAIFCVIACQLGFVRTLLFLLFLAGIVYLAFHIGHGQPAFSYLLSCGIGALFGLQMLINIAVALKLMPITGLTLPFFSYGGSSLISSLAAAGIVLSVYNQKENPLRQEGA